MGHIYPTRVIEAFINAQSSSLPPNTGHNFTHAFSSAGFEQVTSASTTNGSPLVIYGWMHVWTQTWTQAVSVLNTLMDDNGDEIFDPQIDPMQDSIEDVNVRMAAMGSAKFLVTDCPTGNCHPNLYFEYCDAIGTSSGGPGSGNSGNSGQ